VDEDGPEDINGDGLITWMRVEDSEGRWIIDPNNPRMMIKNNDGLKTETAFHVFTEGWDTDKDGRYNEDPPGGIVLNRNFPHILKHNLNKTERWPEDAPETYALTTFLTGRPNISLVLTFSRENTFYDIPRIVRSIFDDERIRVPKYVAEILNIPPQEKYRLKDLVEMFRASDVFPGGSIVNEDSIAAFLGLSRPLRMHAKDVAFYEAVQRDYMDRSREVGLNTNRAALPVLRGPMVAYCYFQLGVPVFSSDLRGIAEDPKGGDEAFIPWKAFHHKTLGDVEIGGPVPFFDMNPPSEDKERILSFHTDYYIDLITKAAELKIDNKHVEYVGDSLYNVDVTFRNDGWFPTATAIGRLTRFSWPITVRLKTTKDQMIWAGEPFEEVPVVGERGGRVTVSWKIKGKRGSRFVITAESHRVGSIKDTIELR
jgi:hypothetical protein